jgi:hypothetical protein
MNELSMSSQLNLLDINQNSTYNQMASPISTNYGTKPNSKNRSAAVTKLASIHTASSINLNVKKDNEMYNDLKLLRPKREYPTSYSLMMNSKDLKPLRHKTELSASIQIKDLPEKHMPFEHRCNPYTSQNIGSPVKIDVRTVKRKLKHQP